MIISDSFMRKYSHNELLGSFNRFEIFKSSITQEAIYWSLDKINLYFGFLLKNSCSYDMVQYIPRLHFAYTIWLRFEFEKWSAIRTSVDRVLAWVAC